MGPISCPETSVRNYHYWPSNNPEERSFHLLPGGNLKTRRKISRTCQESNHWQRPAQGTKFEEVEGAKNTICSSQECCLKDHAGRHFVTSPAFQKRVFFAVIRAPLFELVPASFVAGGCPPPPTPSSPNGRAYFRETLSEYSKRLAGMEVGAN